MNRKVLDLWVGVFVAIGFLSLLFLALKVGNLSGSNFAETYVLQAKFDNIGGLKVRASGEKCRCGGGVGVSEIHFDPQTYEAVVTMTVDTRFKFPKDTFASILTSGLACCEQYIGLDVGGDEKMLSPGDSILKPSRGVTQSAVVLEKLISQFLFNKASEGQDKK